MSVFDDLEPELALWRRKGLIPRFWLRDDDATRPTPALDRLLGLVHAFDAPLLLAVIPADATEALARRIGGERLVICICLISPLSIWFSGQVTLEDHRATN